jgi:hypothetical protein
VGAGPARVTEMALRWQEAGARVTVVTGMPNRRLPDRPDGVVHPDYRGRLFMEEDWQGLRVLRSWLFATPRRGFAWTLLNNLSFLATGTLHSLLRLRGVDVLIASSPPFFAHLAGDVYRRVARVPMVLEIRDLWPDYLVEMGALRNRRAQRALFALERSLLSHARHAVVVTESFRQRVIGRCCGAGARSSWWDTSGRSGRGRGYARWWRPRRAWRRAARRCGWCSSATDPTGRP